MSGENEKGAKKLTVWNTRAFVALTEIFARENFGRACYAGNAGHGTR